MKFECLHEIKWKRTTFEEGNTYTLEKHKGLTAENIERWHKLGLCKAEGLGESGEFKPGSVEVHIKSIKQSTRVEVK